MRPKVSGKIKTKTKVSNSHYLENMLTNLGQLKVLGDNV